MTAAIVSRRHQSIEFFGEPALADARFAANEHQRRPARRSDGPRVEQRAELGVAAHKRVDARARRRRTGRSFVEVENLPVCGPCRRTRLCAKLSLQDCRPLLIQVQGGGAVAAARVTAHHRAPGLLFEWIEPRQLLRTLDRLAVGAFLFEHGDETRQHALCALSELFSIRLDPLDRDVGQKVALVESRGIVQCSAISCQAAIGRLLEGDDIYRHCGVVAPRQRSRAYVDERFESRPGIAKMMQLATKIGECLRVVRFGPERARNTRTWGWRASRVKNQEGDELLLPCTRGAAREAAIREYAEASE